MKYLIGKRNIGKSTFEKEIAQMKCPFRKFSLEYQHFGSQEFNHHEEFEECYKDDCPFYVKTGERDLCKRVLVEVIENNATKYSF